MFKATVNKSVFEIIASPEGIFIDQQEIIWDVVRVDAKYFHIIINNKSYRAEVLSADYSSKTFNFKLNGVRHEVQLKDKFDLLLEKLGFNNNALLVVKDIKAPMPGLILDIFAEEGKTVKKGDPLMILEAMKMENILKSTGDGLIKSVKVKKGESVEKNQILIQF